MATGTIEVSASDSHIVVDGFSPNEVCKLDLRYHYGGVDANWFGIPGYDTVDANGHLDFMIPVGTDLVEHLTKSTYDYATCEVSHDVINLRTV